LAEELSNRHRLSARLEQRLSQKLVLTPQMRQSLEMLQMSVLELQQRILAELMENPLLEEVNDLEQAVEDEETEPAQDPDGNTNDELIALLTRDASDDEDEEPRPPVVEEWRGETTIADPSIYERVLSKRENLTDHLLTQLHLARLSEEDFAVAERIIGNIDENGFLRASLSEIAKSAGTDAKKVAQLLRLIQEFDPPGVGARDLKECLKIQLRHLFAEHKLFTDAEPLSPKLKKLANRAIDRHFDLLVAHKYAQLRKALRISEPTLRQVVSLIENLEPKPGRAFDMEGQLAIVPDVYVVKRGKRFVPILNEQKIPRLRMAANYEATLGTGQLDEEERRFIRQRAGRAQWVIKSIEQWKRTILRVAEAIVELESEFFEKGSLFLKPLKLADVASKLGLHETTVGRTVANKFMDTPRGLFEMKYFFHRGLDTLGGSRVSSVTVKQLIRELIEKEPRDAPYNDQQICTILAERRIKLSRRAVAKYRESMGIPPSHLRRRHML